MIHASARTLDESAQLEQQATLVLSQMGYQIKQANAINAYDQALGPNEGLSGGANSATDATGNGIVFDARPIGICPPADNRISNNPALSCASSLAVFGQDGQVVTGKTQSDTLYISYAAPNDGYNDGTKSLYAGNCSGSIKSPAVPLPTGSITQTYDGSVPQVVSIFYIKQSTDADGTTQTGDLMCGDWSNNNQPIAHNVVNMKVSYLSISSAGVTYYKTAAAVSEAAKGIQNWNAINELEVCLTFLGDPVQSPKYQPASKYPDKDCLGNDFPSNGRIYRAFRQRFYLRNNI
jgi:hypothetical protein